MIVVDWLRWSHRINHDHGTAGVRLPARAVAVPGMCRFGSFQFSSSPHGRPGGTFIAAVAWAGGFGV